MLQQLLVIFAKLPRPLFKGGVDCNVIIIAVATIQNPGIFTVQIILFVTSYLVIAPSRLHEFHIA